MYNEYFSRENQNYRSISHGKLLIFFWKKLIKNYYLQINFIYNFLTVYIQEAIFHAKYFMLTINYHLVASITIGE